MTTERGRKDSPGRKLGRMANSREDDTATVLTTVAIALLSFLTILVAVLKFLELAPGYIVLEAVIAMAVFAAVIGWALFERLNSKPDKYKASPPVLRLSTGRSRAR